MFICLGACTHESGHYACVWFGFGCGRKLGLSRSVGELVLAIATVGMVSVMVLAAVLGGCGGVGAGETRLPRCFWSPGMLSPIAFFEVQS